MCSRSCSCSACSFSMVCICFIVWLSLSSPLLQNYVLALQEYWQFWVSGLFALFVLALEGLHDGGVGQCGRVPEDAAITDISQ